MSDKVTVEVELHPGMKTFLEEMVKKYDLPDVAKAIRVLINHARTEADKQDEIFQKVRCPDC